MEEWYCLDVRRNHFLFRQMFQNLLKGRLLLIACDIFENTQIDEKGFVAVESVVQSGYSMSRLFVMNKPFFLLLRSLRWQAAQTGIIQLKLIGTSSERFIHQTIHPVQALLKQGRKRVTVFALTFPFSSKV